MSDETKQPPQPSVEVPVYRAPRGFIAGQILYDMFFLLAGFFIVVKAGLNLVETITRED